MRFKGKSVRDAFKVGDDVDAVSLATLTVTSATRHQEQRAPGGQRAAVSVNDFVLLQRAEFVFAERVDDGERPPSGDRVRTTSPPGENAAGANPTSPA